MARLRSPISDFESKKGETMMLTLRGGLGNQIIQIAYMLRQSSSPVINTYAVRLRSQLKDLSDIRYTHNAAVHYLFGLIRKGVSFVRGRATDIRIGGVHDGYFQYGDITELIPESLASHLTGQIMIDPMIGDKIDIAVHIRGGDYFTQSASNIYATCTADYYVRALELCRKRLGKETLNVYIVTNDREYAKSLLAPLEMNSGFRFIEYQGDEWGDFSLIYRADAAIIPNSTFSMTARMLRADGMTFAPKQWFLESSRLTAPYSCQFTYLDIE